MTMIKYRSIDGDVLDAMVLSIEGERATVDVMVPGTSVPLRRTRIPYLAIDNGAAGICFVAAAGAAVPVLSRRARRAARAASRP